MPKLTKRLIDAIRYPSSGQVFHRDDEIRGFALRVTPHGKAFIVEKKIHGRARRFTLGPYGPVTLDQARKLAQEKIGEIAKGEDPACDRRNRRRGTTWHDLEKLYLARHAVHKKSGANDMSILSNHLAQWRTRRLVTITKPEVCARHAEIGAAGHKTAANRTVALVRTMFALAKDWGLFEGENPAARVKFFKETSRERFVTPDELPRLWAALQVEPNPYVRAAFLVGLLTGARRTEVLTMRWQDLDLTQGIWTIGDTKAGRQHVLPLPQPAVKAIMTLPRLAENPFVFCGRWGRKHLVNVALPWKRIRQQAKLEDVRIHDLRRTLGSWMVAAGASLSLIGKTLNHTSVSTTAVYARLQLDPVRQALEANAERMLTYAQQAHSDKEG
jgi:integrase